MKELRERILDFVRTEDYIWKHYVDDPKAVSVFPSQKHPLDEDLLIFPVQFSAPFLTDRSEVTRRGLNRKWLLHFADGKTYYSLGYAKYDSGNNLIEFVAEEGSISSSAHNSR